jgi:anti-sigma B factor antagonist
LIVINHTDLPDGAAAVVVRGPLDGSTCRDFEKYIDTLVEKLIVYLIIDASGISYLSSAGIGALVYVQQKIKARNGFFVLCSVSDEIHSLYEILGFNKLFTIANDRAEALDIMTRYKGLSQQGAGQSQSPEPESSINKKEPNAENFGESYVLECGNCKSLVRVRSYGLYMCPNCQTEFSFHDDTSPAPSRTRTRPGVEFTEPFIVECALCKTLIRASSSGSFKCPSCDASFKISEDQTVSFNPGQNEIN